MSAKKHYNVLKNRLKNNPRYANCKLCDEWLDFANFEKFYNETCKRDEFVLDKDLLCPGNTVYGPEFCRYIPNHVNVLFSTHQAHRGDLPVGVTYCGDNYHYLPYLAMVSVNSKNIYLGRYVTVDEAFQAYRTAKLNRVKRVAIEALMAGTIPLEIYIALIRRDITVED